jgi:hypothetical protein
VRKIGILLVALMTLTSCGNTQVAAPVIDPCAKIVESESEAAKKWDARVGEVDRTTANLAKFEVLQWAFIITGNTECFSAEKVASAKSAIALLSAGAN